MLDQIRVVATIAVWNLNNKINASIKPTWAKVDFPKGVIFLNILGQGC